MDRARDVSGRMDNHTNTTTATTTTLAHDWASFLDLWTLSPMPSHAPLAGRASLAPFRKRGLTPHTYIDVHAYIYAAGIPDVH